MAIELFGSQIAPLAAIANVISFLMAGHRSVYPSQILGMKKSELLHIETDIPIEDAQDFNVYVEKTVFCETVSFLSTKV